MGLTKAKFRMLAGSGEAEQKNGQHDRLTTYSEFYPRAGLLQKIEYIYIFRLNGIFDDEIDCKRILREICILRELNHPNLISIIEILEPKDPVNFDTIYVVMEYAQVTSSIIYS